MDKNKESKVVLPNLNTFAPTLIPPMPASEKPKSGTNANTSTQPATIKK